MFSHARKRGDTLIEVVIAVGIFSMIAIGIAAVMSSGTSSAQTALETTLAREEIDSQAETLRFIQAAYAADKSAADKRYATLSQKIIGNAIDISGITDTDEKKEFLEYTPSTCDTDLKNNTDDKKGVYANQEIKDAAFILNPRTLNIFSAEDIKYSDKNYQEKNKNSPIFQQGSSKLTKATIYPRLIFGDASKNEDSGDNTDLTATNTYTNLYRAEGIYIIAVKDVGSSSVVGEKFSGKVANASAYYDFYIRTCWYGSDANQPSTISTVIRLYNPDSLSTK